jgi:outer membrane protein assembly factor BamB
MATAFLFYLLSAAFLVVSIETDVISGWRGPERDGKYPDTGLLKQWPESGPEMLWSFEGLGEGHSSVGIGRNRVFVNGMIGKMGVLFAFDLNGTLLWKTEYGEEWHESYQGTRSTPAVAGNLVYLESGQGVVYCLHGDDGSLVWSVDLLQEYDANNIRWGLTESLLIDGNTIFCTPGGAQHNVVALDRFTGATIWSSVGHGQPAAYCSPILVDHNGTRLIITVTAESVIGIDADTGASYWSIEQRQTHDIHANTPVYHEGKILCSSADAKSGPDGMVLIQLSRDGRKAEVVWRNDEIKNLMGGNILLDGYVYGSVYNQADWYCLDWKTGDLQYMYEDLTSGVIIYADGLFYCYTHRGEMALVEADPEEFHVISTFSVPLGTNQHWAHPVIRDGRLYLRHGNALMVYSIAEK